MVESANTSQPDRTGSWRRIIDEKLAKALGNSFRQQILWILNERTASPTEIAEELHESLNKVCHHIDVLKKARCVERVGEQKNGNRVQTFYRATARAFLEGVDWPKVADSVKTGLRATLLEHIVEDAIEAVKQETYDSEDGSHMSWTPMLLDDQGREEVSELLEEALKGVIAVQERAKERLGPADSLRTSYTVSIMGYPSVGGVKKVRQPVDASDLEA